MIDNSEILAVFVLLSLSNLALITNLDQLFFLLLKEKYPVKQTDNNKQSRTVCRGKNTPEKVLSACVSIVYLNNSII